MTAAPEHQYQDPEFAISAAELREEFQILRPGASFVYFVGHLGGAIKHDGAVDDLRLAALELGERKGALLRRCGDWDDHNRPTKDRGKGLAILTQRRLGEGRYEYRIARRRVRR